MSCVGDLVRTLWVSAQVSTPSFVRHTVIPRLHEAKEVVRLLIHPRLQVSELRGEVKEEQLTVVHIGWDYAKPFLKHTLFGNHSTEQWVGEIPFWRYHEIANWPSGDMVIVEAAEHVIRRLPRLNVIVLPEYVHPILNVRGDWQDVMGRIHKSARREFRMIDKYGYHYETSHDVRDLEPFYRDMYVPTMKNRHGALASLMPLHEAHQYFRHGMLFFVKRGGRRVCGSLFHIDHDTVRFVIVGVIDGDQQMMREGAIGALNYLRLRWVNQQGYHAANFSGVEPHLASGVFQYKRKWGTRISVPTRLHRLIWIRVRRVTPAVSHFLKENPFIIVDEAGRLHGLIAVDDPRDVSDKDRAELERRYATPGLCSLIVRSVRSLADESPAVEDRRLTIPLPEAA